MITKVILEGLCVISRSSDHRGVGLISWSNGDKGVGAIRNIRPIITEAHRQGVAITFVRDKKSRTYKALQK